MLNSNYFKGLKMILFTLACAAPFEAKAGYGQFCTYPDTPDTNFMDGNWEKAASVIVDRPLFLIFYLKPKLYITILSDDGKVEKTEFEQEWHLDIPRNSVEMNCVWQSDSLVRIVVEKEGGGRVHPDLPVSVFIEFQDGHWVLRPTEP